MTKDELRSQFENCKNNYLLGLAGVALFVNEKSYSVLRELSCGFGPYTITFDQVANLLVVPKDREIAVKEFSNMLLRSLTLDSFGLIRDYCEDTGKTKVLTSQSWYQFARLIRDCISNASRFKFRNFDKRVLPATWGDREITAGMDGTYLQLSFFGHPEAWELFQEIDAFASWLNGVRWNEKP